MALAEFMNQRIETALMGLGEEGDQANEVWQNLQMGNRHAVADGKDTERTSAFITLQAIMQESVTALIREGEIGKATLVTYAPLPRTDFAVTKNAAAERTTLDLERRRAKSVRDFLEAGGRLVVACSYHELRAAMQRAETGDTTGPQVTKESMKNFQKFRDAYPHNLAVRFAPLSLKDKHSGALLLAEAQEGKPYAFSIRPYQEYTPQDEKDWGLWAGDRDMKAVSERVIFVKHFLQEKWEIDLWHELDRSALFLAARRQGEEAGYEADVRAISEEKSGAASVSPVAPTEAPAPVAGKAKNGPNQGGQGSI